MTEQSDVVRHVIEVLERCEIDYMLVGSWASGLYGEPRFTQDIDFVVALPGDKAALLYAAFGPPRYYSSRDAIADAVARRSMFNVIHIESGVKVDFNVIKADEWARTQMSRRQRVGILPGCEGWAASPEDVILSKMRFYAEGQSDKHLRDITGICRVVAEGIDRDYIERWANRLGVLDIWRDIQERLNT